MRSKWRRPSQGRRTSGGETRCRNICCIPSSCPASDRGQLTSEGSAFSVATESNERPSTGYHSNTHMGALRCCMMRWVNQRETVVFVHEPGHRRCLMNNIGSDEGTTWCKDEGKYAHDLFWIFVNGLESCVLKQQKTLLHARASCVCAFGNGIWWPDLSLWI